MTQKEIPPSLMPDIGELTTPHCAVKLNGSLAFPSVLSYAHNKFMVLLFGLSYSVSRSFTIEIELGKRGRRFKNLLHKRSTVKASSSPSKSALDLLSWSFRKEGERQADRAVNFKD